MQKNANDIFNLTFQRRNGKNAESSNNDGVLRTGPTTAGTDSPDIPNQPQPKGHQKLRDFPSFTRRHISPVNILPSGQGRYLRGDASHGQMGKSAVDFCKFNFMRPAGADMTGYGVKGPAGG